MPQQPFSTRPSPVGPAAVITDPVTELYDPLLEAARQAFHGSRVVRSVVYGTLEPLEFEALLISFCALGTQVTAPVPDWIERAGRACLDRGYHTIGLALVHHADHEAGHEVLMEADARSLVDAWNRKAGAVDDVLTGSGVGRRPSLIEVDSLLAAPPTEGSRAYVELHESVIAGDSPFAQIAIEYEIEMLSITLGTALLGQIRRLFRPQILDGLTFLTHHVELDEGHTRFNRRQLTEFLTRHPDTAAVMARAGSRALDAYGLFLDDCHRLGRTLVDGGREWSGR